MMTRKPRFLSEKAVREAEKHLSQSDVIMAQLVSDYGNCPLATREYHPFHTLATSIINQQLSAKAADAIERRISRIVPNPFTPEHFLELPVDALRSAGLSSAKARCILELAAHVADGRLSFDELGSYPDENVITALTELPGIGRWTAEMFLIFGLRRPNVLSLGDTGLQRAARLLYGDNTLLERVAQSWHPYCSVASWYLWKHLDNARGI